MRLVLRFLTVLLCFPLSLPAQTVSVFSGLGLGYDAFLRNKEETRYGTSWPLSLGPQFVAGVKYYRRDGFGILFDATLGITGISLVDGSGGFGVRYQQVQSLIMLGSGPQLRLRNESVLMPYIQLGAGFFDYWGTASGAGYNYLPGIDVNSSRWCVLFGAGADWQFRVKIPVSLNLRVVYTPLDVFNDPVSYQSATGDQLQLQGKLLQTILTLRFHLFLKKEKEFSH